MTNKAQNLKAVLFDMDGTLVNSEGIHLENIIEVCAQYGYNFTQADNQRFIGHSMTNIFNALKPLFSKPISFDDFSRENINRFEKIVSPSHLFDGVTQALEYLKLKNIPMYVVTNGEQQAADIALSKTGIMDYFRGIITAAQVEMPKPHPEPYLKAAHQLNIPISQCLIIEDSLTGATSGIEAGGYVIALDHTVGRDQLGIAHDIVSNFSEIPFKSLF